MGTGRRKKKKITWLLKCQEQEQVAKVNENGRKDSTSSSDNMDESKQMEEFEETIHELQQSESIVVMPY